MKSLKAAALCVLAQALMLVAMEPQTTVEVEVEEIEWSSVLYPELNDELNNEADAAMLAAAEELVGRLEDSVFPEISGTGK